MTDIESNPKYKEALKKVDDAIQELFRVNDEFWRVEDPDYMRDEPTPDEQVINGWVLGVASISFNESGRPQAGITPFTSSGLDIIRQVGIANLLLDGVQSGFWDQDDE